MEEEAPASSDLNSLPWDPHRRLLSLLQKVFIMNKLLGVIRTVTIPTYLFDHLKNCQRHYERIEGRKLSNSDTLAILLKQHRDLLWTTLEQSEGV